MALPTYSTGTASVAAGGTVVTGSGGLWSGINVKQGDFISIGGSNATLITEVTDTTHLKIAPWSGAAQSGAAYIIYQNYVGRVVGVAAAEDVGDMLERLKDQAPIFNVPADETVPDPSYGSDGQWAYQIGTNKWWVKSGGVWVLSGTGPSGGISDAPLDGTQYGRQSGGWTPVVSGGGAFTPEDFGAIGDGTTDDSDAIQDAIEAAEAAGGGVVQFRSASYRIETGLWIKDHGVVLEGMGPSPDKGTRLVFAPTADDQTMIKFMLSPAVAPNYTINHCGILNLELYSSDTTRTKTAIELGDTDVFRLENVSVRGSKDIGLANGWGGGVGSIGLKNRGRDFLHSINFEAIADRPIVFQPNVNTAVGAFIDGDLYTFHNTSLVPGTTFHGIEFENDVYISNMTFSGTLWIGGGVDGIHWVDTSGTQHSTNIIIENFRTEQGENKNGWSINIDWGTRTVRGFRMLMGQLDVYRQGIKLNGVRGAILENIQGVAAYETITVPPALAYEVIMLNIGTKCLGVELRNCTWFDIPRAASADPKPTVYGTLVLGANQTILWQTPSNGLGMSTTIPASMYIAPSAAAPMSFPVPIGMASVVGSVASAIEAARVLKSVYVLGASAAATGMTVNTGTAEVTLATITVPAGAMGPNGRVRITTLWTFTSSVNIKTLRHKFGGFGINTYQPNTAGIASLRVQTEIHNRNATNSQISFAVGAGSPSSVGAGWGFTGGANVANTVDTTAAVTILITGQPASAGESITLEAYEVELFPT